jgi:7-cyano-7-deazaguanine reductase
VTDAKLPLGQTTRYPDKYDPGVLFSIPRAEARKGWLSAPLPFRGVDIWNAWELTWLGQGKLPVAATAQFRVPADTPKLIESKSLKLYLNSFAMTQFDSLKQVEETISRDLGAAAGGTVDVRVTPVSETEAASVSRLPGLCLDELSVTCDTWEVDAGLLQADPGTTVEEDLYTHLLRSLCPVTAQPDFGSLTVHYRGPKIDPASLLRYVVSFRQHEDFHEACVERMFADISLYCKPERLSVFALYQRRGGIDINPFRSNFDDQPPNLRLWRQ